MEDSWHAAAQAGRSLGGQTGRLLGGQTGRSLGGQTGRPASHLTLAVWNDRTGSTGICDRHKSQIKKYILKKILFF